MMGRLSCFCYRQDAGGEQIFHIRQLPKPSSIAEWHVTFSLAPPPLAPLGCAPCFARLFISRRLQARPVIAVGIVDDRSAHAVRQESLTPSVAVYPAAISADVTASAPLRTRLLTSTRSVALRAPFTWLLAVRLCQGSESHVGKWRLRVSVAVENGDDGCAGGDDAVSRAK